MRYSGKMVEESDRSQMAMQYGASVGMLMTKATNTHTHTHTHTHSEHVVLLFYGNNGYTNATHCYIICTLPVLFSFPVNPSLFISNPRVPYITEDCF